MSLINKMLQELDDRRAAQGPTALNGPNPAKLTQQLRPVAATRLVRSEIVWRVIGALIAVVVGLSIWVAWQMWPRPVATNVASQSVNRPRPPQPPAQVAAAPAVPAPVPASAIAVAEPSPAPVQAQPMPAPAKVQPLPAPAQARPAPAQPARPGAVQPAPAKPPQPIAVQPLAPKPPASEVVPRVDMLRHATDIAAPIPSREKPAPAAKGPDRKVALKSEAKAAKAPDSPVAPAPKPVVPPQARTSAPASDSGRIDKRVGAAPRERAETEFQRAMVQVNQGRMAEGMDGLRAALAADPSYEVARQTLISLLLETGRTDEAAGALQEAITINPANVGFATLLARIRVERGDLNGGLALLQKYETVGRNNAEYHAFVAALYQRLGRHPEAIEQYQVALRLSSGTGAWWVGLGISQEATGQRKEAVESFRRAKVSGVLSADLVAYVDQRLKHLQ